MATNPATVIDIATGQRIAPQTDTSRAEDYLQSTQAISISTTAGDGITPEADMSSTAEIRAVNVRPPRKDEVYRVATTTGSVTRNLPSAWLRKFITVRALGDDVELQFGASGDTLSLTSGATSTGSAPTMTVNSATGATIKDGEEKSYRLYDETKFAIIGSAGGGTFELWLSTQPDGT